MSGRQQLAGRAGAVFITVVLGLGVAGSAQAAGLSPARAEAVADTLGARAAGTYFDRSRDAMVVAVTDRAAAERVRAAGGAARVVEHSAAELDRVSAELTTATDIAGTAWGFDPTENKVVVSIDDTVDAGELARVRAVLADEGDAARVERIAGTFTPLIAGGEAIRGGGYRCSLGFNVRIGTVDHFLTAGHCTNVVGSWSTPGAVTVPGWSSFPGDDFGLARYTSNTSRTGDVYLYNGTYQDITSAGNAYYGQRVQRSGSTTRLRSGYVTGVNQTVRYAQGTVSGLVRTNVCAEPGDSGGPFFAGSTALGLTSGGSGNCRIGGTTFFQPVTEALSRYGAAVY
jgi:streptogrisin D